MMIVSTSWGKDSVALCDLAVEVLGRGVDLLHLASPYELPGHDEVRAHFAGLATVHVLPPTKTLAEHIAWLRVAGLGYERSGMGFSGGAVAAQKRDRGSEWALAKGYSVSVLGLRADESKHRRIVMRSRGLVYETRDGPTRCLPLGWWTVQDVWAHIVERALPYNHLIYDAETHGQTRETLRSSGWLTTIGAGEGRIAWLRCHHPDAYRRLEQEFPQVGMLR